MKTVPFGDNNENLIAISYREKIYYTKGQELTIKSNRRKYMNRPQREVVCIDNEKNIRILNYRPNSSNPEGNRTFIP
jgi:hypothetical protein